MLPTLLIYFALLVAHMRTYGLPRKSCISNSSPAPIEQITGNLGSFQIMAFRYNAIMSTARRANPKLWEKVKEKVIAGDKGGKPGQWSARKAQLAVAMYKKAGGKYIGPKKKDNALTKWTKEDWGYVGEPKKSRYLPKKARKSLTRGEKAATSRAKNKATKKGKQFAKQPKRIAKKTSRYRK